MKTGRMRESKCLVQIVCFGKGVKTGADLCVVRYYNGYTGDHTPQIAWGPKVTVFAKDVVCD